MPDQRRARGLIDTSVVIDLEVIEPADLPVELAVSAMTMAELAAGPHATADPAERARRQDRLQRLRQPSSRCRQMRRWPVRTAACTRRSARPGAGRAAGVLWICSLRRLPSPRVLAQRLRVDTGAERLLGVRVYRPLGAAAD